MRPTRDELLLEHAEIVARRGTCSRLQVGAVLARDGRLLVSGYNGAPAGMPHCNHTCTCGDSELMRVPHWDGCPADGACTISVHAEANCIAYAARLGIPTLGADLVTTHSPCNACAQLIINAGIASVIYTWEYRLVEPLHLLRSAGVHVLSREMIQ